ncbi:MAG: TolC family protein, partial [Gammaproteobacteria bacterium]|nr:TolC family protein [Gammaproteobacteria bacterium]
SASVEALELSIKDAEQVAIQNDPLIVKYQAKASAYMEEAVAVNRWPDPKLRFGAANIPIDSFSLSKENMTQLIVGIQQAIPPSGLLGEKEEQKQIQAEMERAKAMSRALEVLRGLRKSWMEVYYYDQALILVQESKDTFDQLVNITQYQYRAGRGQQQDVIRAQLELSLLTDKEFLLQQQKESAIAELEKWTGASVRKHTLSQSFPELPVLPDVEEIMANVDFHPSIAVKKAGLGIARKDVAIVKQTYKPTWMLDLSYGLRQDGTNMVDGSSVSRSDFISAVVSLDLPFFTEKRQDKRLNAKGHEVNAASDAVEAQRRELTRIFESAYANWVRLGERMDYYEKTVLPQAAQFAEASRKSYQSRVSDFSELVRARLRQLDSNLQALRLRVERAKAHYDLQYIAGEQ